jgi:hypothetical protein
MPRTRRHPEKNKWRHHARREASQGKSWWLTLNSSQVSFSISDINSIEVETLTERENGEKNASANFSNFKTSLKYEYL